MLILEENKLLYLILVYDHAFTHGGVPWYLHLSQPYVRGIFIIITDIYV